MTSHSVFGLNLKVSQCNGAPLDIRCGWSLATVLGVNDHSDTTSIGVDATHWWLSEAETLGYRDGLTETVPLHFVGTPLEGAWESGAKARDFCEAYRGGTQQEWNALSSEAQDRYWDSFHDMCDRGIGDDHYYYEILMARHLVGYVGH